jgi:hypothetical protein
VSPCRIHRRRTSVAPQFADEPIRTDVKVVGGPEGYSVYVNDYRVAGPKPWGGGQIVMHKQITDVDLAGAGLLRAALDAPALTVADVVAAMPNKRWRLDIHGHHDTGWNVTVASWLVAGDGFREWTTPERRWGEINDHPTLEAALAAILRALGEGAGEGVDRG